MSAFEEKLLAIFECVEKSCISSVRIFDEGKGHSSRSVGFAAYEERQQKMLELGPVDNYFAAMSIAVRYQLAA